MPIYPKFEFLTGARRRLPRGRRCSTLHRRRTSTWVRSAGARGLRRMPADRPQGRGRRDLRSSSPATDPRGYVLACQAAPLSDVVVEIPPESH